MVALLQAFTFIQKATPMSAATPVSIRPVRADDFARWQAHFDAYTRFYKREPVEALTQYTWARIMDPKSVVQAIVAETASEGVIGFANYLPHENTATMAPVCYLQDLFTDPACRAKGVGQQMIDWLVAECQRQGWLRLYWMTQETNYRARGLYDKYGPHSGFLRYVVQVAAKA